MIFTFVPWGYTCSLTFPKNCPRLNISLFRDHLDCASGLSTQTKCEALFGVASVLLISAHSMNGTDIMWLWGGSIVYVREVYVRQHTRDGCEAGRVTCHPPWIRPGPMARGQRMVLLPSALASIRMPLFCWGLCETLPAVSFTGSSKAFQIFPSRVV